MVLHQHGPNANANIGIYDVAGNIYNFGDKEPGALLL